MLPNKFKALHYRKQELSCGFISISDCSNVIVKDCILTGQNLQKSFIVIFYGSKDISVTRSINVSFINLSD